MLFFIYITHTSVYLCIVVIVNFYPTFIYATKIETIYTLAGDWEHFPGWVKGLALAMYQFSETVTLLIAL